MILEFAIACFALYLASHTYLLWYYRWRPIRTLKPFEHVILFESPDIMAVGYRDGGQWVFDAFQSYPTLKPTHWRHKPAKPLIPYRDKPGA